MSGWKLTLRTSVDAAVDASPIRLSDFATLSAAAVQRVVLRVGGHPMVLGELFSVTALPGDEERLVLEGDLSRFYRVGEGHARGELRVEGSVGDYCGCSMSGGRLSVVGDAGDFLGAPYGARQSGMRGGRVEVGGSAGDYVGHRMRRGELLIEGAVGQFAASHQVAGTVAVAGAVGEHVGYGMRRGTFIAARMPELPPGRFSRPVTIRTVFPSLIRPDERWGEKMRRLIKGVAGEAFWVSRGDRAVGGQGEVWAPMS